MMMEVIDVVDKGDDDDKKISRKGSNTLGDRIIVSEERL